MDPGRPDKLTPDAERTILNALRLGLYVETACDLAEIERKTFYNWLKKGEGQKDGKYRRFLHRVKRAQANAEGHLVGKIYNDPSWQSKAWMLERKFNKRWGRHAGEAESNSEDLVRQVVEAFKAMDALSYGRPTDE